jgi:hypothetical protein
MAIVCIVGHTIDVAAISLFKKKSETACHRAHLAPGQVWVGKTIAEAQRMA